MWAPEKAVTSLVQEEGKTADLEGGLGSSDSREGPWGDRFGDRGLEQSDLRLLRVLLA